MFTRLRQRFSQRVESTQHQAIRLVSFRQVYREKRDKNKFRALFTEEGTIQLSKEQMEAAVSHAKETLVVAGAGSGKTSVLVGRAQYLVASKRATPNSILLLAYNKDAAKELEARTRASGLNVKAKTFHSFGLSVIGGGGVAFTKDGEIAYFLNQYLKGLDKKSKDLLTKYFAKDLVPNRDFSDFNNISEYAAYIRGGLLKTLAGENVRSYGEWLIANILFYFSVPYEYQKQYKLEGEQRGHHTPDFCIRLPERPPIWVEYFGVDRNGTTAPWVNQHQYLQIRDWKRHVHKRHGTDLLELTYGDVQHDRLFGRLKEELIKREVPLRPRSFDEILQKAEDHGYASRFMRVVQQFLQHVRSNKLDVRQLKHRDGLTLRDHAFLDIFGTFLAAYEEELERKELPDFPQMIVGASERIESGEYRPRISHLLVDEFQDISHDRHRLIEAIRQVEPALEVTYVGDDWQSIYSFSGSDVTIMRELSAPKANRRRIDLTTTYRLPQEIADISSGFIQKNALQLRKKVRASEKIAVRGAVKFHWNTKCGEHQANVAQVITAIGEDATNPEMSLKVLSRYRDNIPGSTLKAARAFVQEHWEGPVDIQTIHAAKGLEADYVIVTDLLQDNRGFPSTIEDDPVMRLVLPEKDLYQHGEERRLLYVAITRGRRESHLICPIDNPSLFAHELKADGSGIHIGLDDQQVASCPVCQTGSLIKNQNRSTTECSNRPVCDYIAPRCDECNLPMTFTADSKRTYVCSNHPNQNPAPCPVCDWGVMVSRKNSKTGEAFFSCHTWPQTRCPGRQRRAPTKMVTNQGAR